jgi:hypothetical protein
MKYLSIIFFFFCTSSIMMLQAQTIDTVSPNSGVEATAIDVSISGQNTHFGQGTSTTQVWFNQGSSTLYSSSVTVDTDSNLTAHFNITYGTPLGLYTANVYNSVDNAINLTNSFTVTATAAAPAIVNVAPSVGELGSTIAVSISGQNTHFTQGTGTVSFSQGSSTLFASSVNIINDLQMDALLDIPPSASLGDYDVSSFNVLDGYLNLINGFTVDTPACGNASASITQQACSFLPANIHINGGFPPYTVFIDGQPGYSPTNDYSYYTSVLGNHIINSITDNFGCIVQYTDSIITLNPFTASYTVNNTCAGTAATFVNIINSVSPVTSIIYDYGDGNFGSNNIHTYINSGIFAPSLSVMNAEGCIAVANNTLDVHPSAEIIVISNTGATCGASNGSFEIASAGTSPFVFSISGPSYSSASPFNNNLVSGNYNAAVTDANGCVSNLGLTVANISTLTNITGNINTVASGSASNALVQLFLLDDTLGALAIAAEAIADSNGNYSFANLAEGNYILLASPDSTLPASFPTYYNNQTIWYFADTIQIACASQLNINVTLSETLVGSGNSNIIGNVNDLTGLRASCLGNPVANISIILVDNSTNTSVAATQTDVTGTYQFNAISDGNYSLIANIPGLTPTANYSFILGANETINNRDFFIDTLNNSIDTICIFVTAVSQNLIENNSAIIFPNPFTEQATIKYAVENKSKVSITIYNLLGEKIQTVENATKNAGTYQTTINSPIVKGIYFVQLQINEKQQVFKIVCTD